jgi:hypothetical protein
MINPVENFKYWTLDKKLSFVEGMWRNGLGDLPRDRAIYLLRTFAEDSSTIRSRANAASVLAVGGGCMIGAVVGAAAPVTIVAMAAAAIAFSILLVLAFEFERMSNALKRIIFVSQSFQAALENGPDGIRESSSHWGKEFNLVREQINRLDVISFFARKNLLYGTPVRSIFSSSDSTKFYFNRA